MWRDFALCSRLYVHVTAMANALNVKPARGNNVYKRAIA